MKNLSMLIKPASSSCNLKCRYCFYADVSEHRTIKNNGIMKQEVAYALIDKAVDNTDEDGTITFAFQGGEPTVARLDFFKMFCSHVDEKKKSKQQVNYAIQTNAYVIDNDWCSFFHDYDFLVGVSLDGYKGNHDYFRLTTGNKTTYNKVMQVIGLLRKHHVRFNVLTVLSKQLAKHPQKLYDFYKNEKIDYIQLIPCLSGLDEPNNPFSLTPQLFSSFYKKFYDYWLAEMNSGIYRSIGLFDNIIPMFADIPPQQCGLLGYCSLQFVVESDGSIYPCDFYVLDEYKGGNIIADDFIGISQSKAINKFLSEKRPINKLCNNCAFLSVCHGNCKRMNSVYIDNDYCGYQDFLMHAYPTMLNLSKRIQNNK